MIEGDQFSSYADALGGSRFYRNAISMRRFYSITSGVGKICAAASCFLLGLAPSASMATDVVATGYVLQVEGHGNPACRRLVLKKTDGSLITFRLADMGSENSILSVALSALATGYKVDIDYDVTQTTGCGSEPRVVFITIKSPNSP